MACFTINDALLKATGGVAAVVALTTDTREESVAEIAESGADQVVRMPFRPDDLRTAVKTALNSRLEH